MITTPGKRLVFGLEMGALVFLLLYLGVHTLPRAWGKLNTDFPNYYVSARLAREGYDTSRMYEWRWLQREKDHRAVDISVIGLLPITPISTLPMWPLTGFAPLTAKHVWLVLNLVLLAPLGWLIRLLTGLPYRRIALAFALSFPLHRNLLYGQFYVLLLLLMVAACWAYLREKYALAGVLVAIAAACKIFPILFFVWFLRRKAWRALVAGAVTGAAAIAVSISVYGWAAHRTYVEEILPWTMHGEGLPPYVTTSGSISSILHYLFLNEPQWNPHPWHNSPLWYALLLPTLQMIVLAPAILLICAEDRQPRRIQLEWSALLTACLAVSTIPASYNFVLLVFPVCVVAAILLERKSYRWLALLVVIFAGIGVPLPSPTRMIGPAILLYVPRLLLVLALLAGMYVLLQSERSKRRLPWTWGQSAWATAMAVAVMISVYSTLQRERAVRQEYAYRLPFHTQALLAASPQFTGTGISYVAMTPAGYSLEGPPADRSWSDSKTGDDLSFTGGARGFWIEKASNGPSRIVEGDGSSRTIEEDAREPMLSSDETSLAFLRDDHGRGRLFVRRNFQSESASNTVLTPPSLNVYEASFLSEREYAFSAVRQGRPEIYLTDTLHANSPLYLGEARYPALSPDGRWLAYSRFDRGAWNLWLRDEQSGATRRIADVPCNQIEASWEDDSKTLLYGSDCGRSLWFTAVARRRVVP